MDEVERIYEEGERSRREELKHTHPIFSRIDPWLSDQLRATHDALTEQHKWRPHEHALALCRENDLQQHAYFLQRDLAFMREVCLVYNELTFLINMTEIVKLLLLFSCSICNFVEITSLIEDFFPNPNDQCFTAGTSIIE